LSSCLLSKNVKIKIYKTLILPFVLYGCEIHSLTLREEHRLRVFKNRVLRRLYVPEMGEVAGGWRKLYNEELHSFYASPYVIRVTKSWRVTCTGHIVHMAETEMCTKFWFGMPEGKRLLKKPRHVYEDNIKMDYKEIG
jgi:hypothetical protein